MLNWNLYLCPRDSKRKKETKGSLRKRINMDKGITKGDRLLLFKLQHQEILF